MLNRNDQDHHVDDACKTGLQKTRDPIRSTIISRRARTGSALDTVEASVEVDMVETAVADGGVFGMPDSKMR